MGKVFFYLLPFIPLIAGFYSPKALLVVFLLWLAVEVYFALESYLLYVREQVFLGFGSLGWLLWGGLWLIAGYLVYLVKSIGILLSGVLLIKLVLLLTLGTGNVYLMFFVTALSFAVDVYALWHYLPFFAFILGAVTLLIFYSILFKYEEGFWEKEEKEEEKKEKRVEGGRKADNMPLSWFFSRSRVMLALGIQDNIFGKMLGLVVKQSAYFFASLETLIQDYKQQNRITDEVREMFAEEIKEHGIDIRQYVAGDIENLWASIWNLPCVGMAEDPTKLPDYETLKKKWENITSYFEAGTKISLTATIEGETKDVVVEIPASPRWGNWLFIEAVIDEAFLRFLQENVIPNTPLPHWLQFDNLFLTYFPEYPLFKYFVRTYYVNLDKSATNLAVVGRIGTGKSSSVYIPNLLTWNGNAIVYDPKGELFKKTAYYRKHELEQDIYVINAQAQYDKEQKVWRLYSHRYNIIDLSSASASDDGFDFTDTDIQDFINALKKKITPEGGGGEEKAWIDRAGEIARAYLVFVNMLPRQYRKLETFVHLLFGNIPYDLLPIQVANELKSYNVSGKVLSQTNLKRILAYMKDKVESLEENNPENKKSYRAIHMAISSAQQFTESAPETYTSIEASLNNMASKLSENVVLTLSEATDFRYQQMIRKPFTLYLITSLAPTESQEFYFSMVIDLLLKEISRTAPESSTSKTTEIEPLALFIDEFANIPPISNIGKLINTLRSRRVFFVLGIQGIEQVRARYGEEAKEIYTGIGNWIFYSVALNPDDEKTLSEMLDPDLVKKITRLDAGKGYLAVGDKGIHPITQMRYFLIPELKKRSRETLELNIFPEIRLSRLNVLSLAGFSKKEEQTQQAFLFLLREVGKVFYDKVGEALDRMDLTEKDIDYLFNTYDTLVEMSKDEEFLSIIASVPTLRDRVYYQFIRYQNYSAEREAILWDFLSFLVEHFGKETTYKEKVLAYLSIQKEKATTQQSI